MSPQLTHHSSSAVGTNATQTAANSTRADASQASSATASPHTPAFASLLAMFHNTVDALRRENLIGASLPPIERIQKEAYKCYTYFPHSKEDAGTVYWQRNPNSNDKIMRLLCRMSDHEATRDKVSIRRQAEDGNELETPTEAVKRAGTDRQLLQQIHHYPYLIIRSGRENERPGEGDIEGRLSITVKEQFAPILLQALFDLSVSEKNGFHRSKMVGPDEYEIRSETGIIYGSTADPGAMAELALALHEQMAHRYRENYQDERPLPMDYLYAELPPPEGGPPGSQPVRPGISYSEKPAGLAREISSGTSKSWALAWAVLEHLKTGMKPEAALAKHFARCGYSSGNPALARPGESDEALKEFVRELQKFTPDEYKDPASFPTSIDDSGRAIAGRARFERTLLEARPD